MKPALPAHEQDVLDRLESAGNPLGWKPETRVDGVAIIRADSEPPNMPGHTRILRIALTEGGMVGMQEMTFDAEGNRVHALPPRIRPVPPRPPHVVPEGASTKEMELNCPSDGAKMVRDGGWYRCPTPKCKVII